ncbi:MAG: hypothetical protein KGL59_07030 [Acidobacteriota bacterium]|nr:hypothetical protein [Acidobacteriota bacterium]
MKSLPVPSRRFAKPSLSLVFAALIFCLAPKALAQQSAAAAPTIESATAHLKMRAIGPAIMMGRIDDLAVVESDPKTIYLGAATGGVWKTTDAGMTWTPLFDKESNMSIGALAIAPSDPSIVWAGTGEANNRQSSSWGNGVYKSTDGGHTWAHMGLDETQAIGRIVIDPMNSDVVYVAALGHLWGPNPERGLFKSTDGGKTWQKVLFINDDTGVSDVAIDPQSPNILYAAAYERRRTVWGFNGGGPNGGVYRTTDAGATWKKLAGGLPEGDVGRIGLSVYRKDPNIVYAEVQAAKGGIFRSEDKGLTWKKMSSTDPRPSYFSQIRIDPNNDLRIWLGGVNLYYSDDGGKTFNTRRVLQVHSDFHAIWIDPNNSNYMLVGCDGGVYLSRDLGQDWDHLNVVPLGQIYEVGYDNQQPYHVCGGFQDNAEWCGPSRTWFLRGIVNSDWTMVGGGDGFYVKPDPSDPDTVYTESQDGGLIRRNLRTNEARSIRPVPPSSTAPPYRFNWNSPLIISTHNHNTIYYGGNYVFKSTDRGDTWTRLGPDLTNNVDRNTLPVLGKLPTKDTLSLNDGVEWWPSITAIAESPLNAEVLWVGTDDGNLQVTRDGGRNWSNVVSRVPGVPKGTYVSRVVASKYEAGTAFVAFDGHRSNDFHVYLFKTTDYGQSWHSIANGLPESGGTIHVIRQHPSDPNLLFVGAEFGAWFSVDGGEHWNRLGMGLPNVRVDDMQIQPRENDLIIATHGRSIYILDDLTPIEQISDKVLGEDLHLFPIRPAISWRMYQNSWFTGQQVFAGPNPPYGALIDFYLKSKPAKDAKVKITVLDSAGKVVREIEDAKAEAGINRTNWDLRYNPPVKPTPEQLAAQEQGFFFGGPRGPMVEPGTYTVKVSAGDTSQTQTVKVEEDPRIQITAAARTARQDAIMRLYDLYKTADHGQKTIVGLKKSLDEALAAWKKPDAPKIPDAIRKQAEDLSKKVDDLRGKFVSERGFGAGGPLHYTPPPLPQQIGRLMFQLDGYSGAPTAPENEQIADVSKQLTEATAALDKLVKTDLARLNKALNDAGVPHITAVPTAPPPFRPE